MIATKARALLISQRYRLFRTPIGVQEGPAADARTFTKVDPATGREICRVARSSAADVSRAVDIAKRAQPGWAALTVVKRGDILRQIALLRERRETIAELGRARRVVEGRARRNGCGHFQTFCRRGPPFRWPDHDQRGSEQGGDGRPAAAGVAGLIIAANTPIANVAGKHFPPCCAATRPSSRAGGHAAVGLGVRPPRPRSGCWTAFTRRCTGLGRRPARRLSSIRTLRWSASRARARSAAGSPKRRAGGSPRRTLELGGKNPLIVCDDAD